MKDKSKQVQFDFKGLADWVEIFQAGLQTDSKGRTKNFSTADLDQMVSNYNPGQPVRHVITHNELYSPFGYGDVAELKREGDTLFAKSKNIEPQFETLVKTGRLPDRSVRIIPTDKGWKLSHVAWLGAEPPAVEGLAPVSFEAGQQGFDFALDTRTPNTLVRMMRNMREFLIEKFGQDAADKVMPDYEIDSLNRHVIEAEQEEQQEQQAAQFSKSTEGVTSMPELTQADIDAARQAAKDEAAAEYAQRESALQQQLNQERGERRFGEYSAFVQQQVNRGVAPAMLEGAAEFMLQLDTGESFEFSRGDGTVKRSPLDFFKGVLSQLPATVKLGESEDFESDQQAADFSAPAGTTVDAASRELYSQILAYQKQHGCSYQAAVSAVAK